MGEINLHRIKEEVISIIEEGINSKHINSFISHCIKIAKAYLFSKVNKTKRDRLNEEHGFSNDTDLALDCIADLFETRDGFYYQINDFFKFGNFKLKESQPEEIFAKLRCLIWSSISNRIYEISNPFYTKIRKAVNICFDRNPSYKKFYSGEKIFLSHRTDINTELPCIPAEKITELLLEKDTTDHSIPKLVEIIFKHLDLQNEYSNYIELNDLVCGIVAYHNKRIINHLNEEEISQNLTSKSEFREAFAINLNEFLQKRKQIFKKKKYQSEIYYFTCLKSELNFLLKSLPASELLIFLYNSNFTDFGILTVLLSMFNFVNENDNILKAIKFKILVLVLCEFYINFKDL